MLINLIIHNLISFIAITSFIVFIHEFGHFIVARFFGVKVDEFSIGFGKEIFGFKDKKQTRWKFCFIPFGGYVKMYGDKNIASFASEEEALNQMTKEEREISFLGKKLYQKFLIVLAGPVFNFFLAIIIFTALFKINGINTVSPIIGDVVKNSPAANSGIKIDDKILSINEIDVKSFDEVRSFIEKNKNNPITLKIERKEQIKIIKLTPEIKSVKDFFGEDHETAMIGISSKTIESKQLDIFQSFIQANKEVYNISIAITKALHELITGDRDLKELGGPVKIAKYSGKTVDMGIVVVMWFVAMISINLGIMNLLPIPALDGGHLLIYTIEAISRKKISKKIQQIIFSIGFSIIICLMIFTTYNDVKQLCKNSNTKICLVFTKSN